MKNFKFINQSLWAGSSPNQTGETLTRENRIGVKSWLNRGLMLLFTILTLGVGQMWAGGFWSTGMWKIWGWNGSSNDWHWNNYGKLFDSNADCNLGIITSGTYCFKGLGVNTYGSDVKGVYCNVTYPNGNKDTGMQIYHNSGSDNKWWQSTGMWDYTIDHTKPGNYEFKLEFYLNSGSSDYGHNTRKITWTTPGFTGVPEDPVDFGSKNIIGLYSETTINFNHYGTALTSSCTTSITGTNSSEFVVRKIEDDRVIVAFLPTTTSTRTAKLTLTDAHGKTCEIDLTGSAVALGTTTRLYFNDYVNHSDWAADVASYRFVCQYTSGVYTNFPMTKCDNSTYNYYADVELKAGNISTSIDRYNPASPYTTWNSSNSLSMSAENQYAVSNGKYTAYATDFHPFNDVTTGGYFYYDNSQSGFTNTLYMIIGHEYLIGGTSNPHSVAYTLTNVPNTKLYYTSSYTAWGADANYYAVVGASSAPSIDAQGSSCLSTIGTGGYTKAFQEVFDISGSNTYLASATGSNTDMTINKCATVAASKLNTVSQTFNYELSTDGGESFSNLTSGVSTPGQLDMDSYKFVDGTYSSVSANSTQTLSANGSTYTKTFSTIACAGATTYTASSPRAGYTFVGWYEGNTLMTALEGTTSFTYYPNTSKTITARYKAHRYTINFNANDDQYDEAPAATGTTASMSNVVYDQSATLTANGFHRIGYKFTGWNTEANGTGESYTNGATAIFNLTTSDGGSETLYAQWEADKNTFTNAAGDGAWGNVANWSAGKVPENDDAEITISDNVTISSGTSVHVGSVDVSAGKLTIEAGGALEVAGTIDNDDPTKIVIKSTTTSQGVLIFNSTGSTAATVNMTMNAASGKFQFIAIPISYVDVSSAFAGKGVYTYVWKNSAHNWEQRGYYDGISSYEAVIAKGKGSTSFAGNLVSNNSGFSSGTLSYSAAGYGDVYMFGNSWPAPIKRSAMTLSGIASVNILLKDNSWDGVISDDIIPALQAYAVVVGSSGGSVTINYDNAVRSVTSGRTTPLKAPQRTTTDSQGPISIYVSANEMQTRIRLFEDATRFTDDLDEGWEAYYMAGEGYAGEMYAVGPERKMNVLATSNLEGTVVGFVPGQATDYTISFAGDGKGYYLNDVKKEESTLIEEGNTYEFTSDPSTNATRFVISKTPIAKTPTSIENTNDGVKARKQLIDGALYIIRDGRIYTVTGALVK